MRFERRVRETLGRKWKHEEHFNCVWGGGQAYVSTYNRQRIFYSMRSETDGQSHLVMEKTSRGESDS